MSRIIIFVQNALGFLGTGKNHNVHIILTKHPGIGSFQAQIRRCVIHRKNRHSGEGTKMDADSSMKSQVFVDEWRVRESRTVKK